MYGAAKTNMAKRSVRRLQLTALSREILLQGQYQVDEITSNYQSPANTFQSAAISFKFSINGKDNEMKSGTDHHFNCIATNGRM